MVKVLFRRRSLGKQVRGAIAETANSEKIQSLVGWGRSNSGRWWLTSGGTAILLLLNSRLVFSTGLGIATMVLIYLWQDGQWKPWAATRKWLTGWNRALLLAVGSGSIITLGTYLAISVGVEAGSPWRAIETLLQNSGILAILGLLLWQQLQPNHQPVDREQAFQNLNHPDPLTRLVAVHQLTRQVQVEPDLTYQRQVASCFRLLLSRETEPIIRDALLEGLESFSPARQLLPSANQPWQPTNQRVPQRMRQSSKAEAE